jgi:para-nitrobenzyl esterase
VTPPEEDTEPQYWPLSERTYEHIMTTRYNGQAKTIESEYTGAAYPTPFDAFSAVNTDSYVLGCGISPQADIFALQTLTYRYEFSDPRTPLPKLVALGAGGTSLGAYHSGELQYLFSEKGYPGPRSPAQQALSARMIRYWGNFVKSGDPTDGGNLQWPRYELGKSDLLTLSPSGDSVANNFETEHHCQLWKSLAQMSSSVEGADRPR